MICFTFTHVINCTAGGLQNTSSVGWQLHPNMDLLKFYSNTVGQMQTYKSKALDLTGL